MTITVNITPNGQKSLPADIRKRLGLVNGGAVFEETDEGVILRTAAQAVKSAQAIAKRFASPHSSTEAFLTRRRDDSGE
jgi:AbrB family looped-hinge helix DNA binding protein